MPTRIPAETTVKTKIMVARMTEMTPEATTPEEKTAVKKPTMKQEGSSLLPERWTN